MSRPAAAAGTPQFAVRVEAGLVSYFNDDPILTYEQAEHVRDEIEKLTGELGEVEKVYVLTPGWGAVSNG